MPILQMNSEVQRGQKTFWKSHSSSIVANIFFIHLVKGCLLSIYYVLGTKLAKIPNRADIHLSAERDTLFKINLLSELKE